MLFPLVFFVGFRCVGSVVCGRVGSLFSRAAVCVCRTQTAFSCGGIEGSICFSSSVYTSAGVFGRRRRAATFAELIAEIIRAHEREGQEEAEHEEQNGVPFGQFGQHIAGTSAEEGVGGATSKGGAEAGLFLGKLHQHQQDEEQAVEKEYDGEKFSQDIHDVFLVAGVVDDIRKAAGFKAGASD